MASYFTFSRIVVKSLLLGWLCCLSSAAISEDPEAERFELQFIPPDVTIGGIVHPQEVIETPDAEEIPLHSMFGEWLLEDGFVVGDLTGCEQLLLVGWFSEPGVPPKYGVVLRYSNPLSNEILQTFVPEPTTHPSEKATYYVPKDPKLPWGCLIDERTLLLARRPELKKMIAAQGADGSVKRLLSFLPASRSLSLVADLWPLRVDLPPEGVKPPNVQGPEMEMQVAWVEVLRRTRAILITFDMTPSWYVQCSLLAEKESDTEQLAAVMKKLPQIFLAGAVSTYDDMRDQLGANPDPARLAQLDQIENIVRQAFGRLTTIRRGKLVETSLEGQADVGLMVGIMLPAMELARRAAINTPVGADPTSDVPPLDGE